MSKTEKALRLVRKGVPVLEASRRVGCHSTCVYKAAKKLGIALPNGRRTGRHRVVKRKRVSHPELGPSFSTFNRETKFDPSGLTSAEALMPDPRLREHNEELRAEIRVLRSIIASAIKGRE